MKKKVIKLVCSVFENETRDKREIAVLRDMGFSVTVVAKQDEAHPLSDDVSDGFPLRRLSTRPLGGKVPNALNRLLSVFTWAWQVGKMKPDLISAHDLPALLIAYLSNALRRRKARLVYDAHEFEIGRTAKRSLLQKKLVLTLERFLMRRCAFSMMVNDKIADEVQRIHRLKKRPVTVRNIPPLWTLESDALASARQSMLAYFTPQDPFILLYHGLVAPQRGIETLLEVIRADARLCLMILGDAVPGYDARLQALIASKRLEGRVCRHPAVPFDELCHRVAACDVGMITIPPVSQSYYYMLPNKFFESVQAELPVITSDFPVIAPLVRRHGLGLVCDPTDAAQIAGQVLALMAHPEQARQYRQNAKAAKRVLCWEQERKVLESAYRPYL